MSAVELKDIYLWLSMNEVSYSKLKKLEQNFDSFFDVWHSFERFRNALNNILGEAVVAKLSETRTQSYIERVHSYLEKNSIGFVTVCDELYPRLLRQEEVRANPLIFYKGDVSLFNAPSFAIVGTRKGSQAGLGDARTFAATLASSGYAIVSGMALGIDAAAHEGALSVKGKTIAVLGSGLMNPRPVENMHLFRAISSSGLVVSEYPPLHMGAKYTYPQRNRIISGLAYGTCVIEAGESSGALYTADFCIEQGRDLFALPGNISSYLKKGTNAMLKDGRARLATCPQDILEELNTKFGQIISKNGNDSMDIDQLQLDNIEKRVYNLLAEGIQDYDTLVNNSGLMPSELNNALTKLELFGIVSRIGNKYKL